MSLLTRSLTKGFQFPCWCFRCNSLGKSYVGIFIRETFIQRREKASYIYQGNLYTEEGESLVYLSGKPLYRGGRKPRIFIRETFIQRREKAWDIPLTTQFIPEISYNLVVLSFN